MCSVPRIELEENIQSWRLVSQLNVPPLGRLFCLASSAAFVFHCCFEEAGCVQYLPVVATPNLDVGSIDFSFECVHSGTL